WGGGAGGGGRGGGGAGRGGSDVAHAGPRDRPPPGGRAAGAGVPRAARLPLHGARWGHRAAAELRPDERRHDVTRAQVSGLTSTATVIVCSPPPSTTPRSGITSPQSRPQATVTC